MERATIFAVSTKKPIERAVCMSDHPVIQPSVVKCNNKVHILFRNFDRAARSKPEKRVAMSSHLLFSSAQNKLMFAPVIRTDIPNHNESLIGINDPEGNALTVYNAVENRGDLTLGFLNEEDDVLKSDPILVLNEESRASYPNHCYNNKGQLVVCFTSYDKGINEGSRICIATVSKNYKKILSRKYIDSDMLP
jgi:hypothetical protein